MITKDFCGEESSTFSARDEDDSSKAIEETPLKDAEPAPIRSMHSMVGKTSSKEFSFPEFEDNARFRRSESKLWTVVAPK